jgi:hypothetical protein
MDREVPPGLGLTLRRVGQGCRRTETEGGEDGAVTTVTFEERGVETLIVIHDLYPSKEALDGAIASGSTGGFSEQLDELLVTLDASLGS